MGATAPLTGVGSAALGTAASQGSQPPAVRAPLRGAGRAADGAGDRGKCVATQCGAAGRSDIPEAPRQGGI